MTLSVVGAGFGRTGTLSLKAALERLGVGRCYHMVEVWGNPGHGEIWQRAIHGEPVDWDALLSGFAATVDWPACHFWRELADANPDSLVVLTRRDPERWYESVAQTIHPVLTRPLPPEIPQHIRVTHAMSCELVLERTFGGRFLDRRHAISVYERHNERVMREVPAGRLLVYEASEGWGPLCARLGVEEPEEAFPRVNSQEEFRARMALDPAPSSPRG